MRRRAPWNRCDYCGRWISFADFEVGRAKREFGFVAIETLSGPDVDESFETYHEACRVAA